MERSNQNIWAILDSVRLGRGLNTMNLFQVLRTLNSYEFKFLVYLL